MNRVYAEKSDAMIQAFARAVEQAGGKALLVGGIVRDELLGLPSKDYDFEIFGLPADEVSDILNHFGNVKEVGKQFGVLHLHELDWDVALPRREVKTGEGHRGFDVVPDPTMTIEEAARRRDLTINAMSKDPLTGEIIDPLGGLKDLRSGILRMADPATFGEDPLRALRVAQFAARFDFEVEAETLRAVGAQPLEELPGERIFTEFEKMLLKGKKPSKGIEVLRESGLLRYFPEIDKLQGVPQDPDHHPEGDVYVHTLMVLDKAAEQRTGNPAFDMPLMFAALGHDFGKPEFTQVGDVSWHDAVTDEEAALKWETALRQGEKIKSHGHEEGGLEPARNFMHRMKAPKELTKQVGLLVAAHLRPQLMPERAGRKGYRRLARLLGAANVSPELLVAVSKADTLGRTTEKAIRGDTHLQDIFLNEFKEYTGIADVSKPVGISDAVTGKDLIAKGMKPGPEMGKFLALTRSIQDETGITDKNELIELATKFIDDRSKLERGEEAKKSDLDCGDSHIRPGETCYDGDYREAREKGLTKSNQGPSEFRTHPDPTQPDYLLWRSHFDWPWKEGDMATHPGIGPSRPLTKHAQVEAEPARQHKRSITFQPRWFDSGTRFSTRNLEGPGSRDGFGGSKPYDVKQEPPSIPGIDDPNWESVNPELGLPASGKQETTPHKKNEHTLDSPELPATDPHEFLNVDFMDWDTPPTQSDIGPEHREPFPGAKEFPATHYPADKGAGYLATEIPIPQLLDWDTPAPSPMRAGDSGSSQPGKFVRKPGGGGLNRAPMIRPQGEPKPTGFLPVVNLPSQDVNTKASHLDSHFDQHELERGIQVEKKRTKQDERLAKEVAKDNLMSNHRYYSDIPRDNIDNIVNKEKNQTMVNPSETVEGTPKYGRGGGGSGGYVTLRKGGPGGGDDKSREYWDMDRTGKKPGFMSIQPPKENIYHAEEEEVEAVRTIEDLMDIQTVFPHDYVPNWGTDDKPEIGPSTKHRNKREVAPDPIKGDEDIHQKQVQPLIPNQKLGIAIDPKGPLGERITLLQPLFTEVSPAIQALRSQRFEDHFSVVVDGPPEWILNLLPILEAMDKSSNADDAATLYKKVLQIAQQRGLTIEYTQEPR